MPRSFLQNRLMNAIRRVSDRELLRLDYEQLAEIYYKIFERYPDASLQAAQMALEIRQRIKLYFWQDVGNDCVSRDDLGRLGFIEEPSEQSPYPELIKPDILLNLPVSADTSHSAPKIAYEYSH